MTGCDQFDPLTLRQYLDDPDRLGPEKAKEIEDHLEVCEVCQGILDQHRTASFPPRPTQDAPAPEMDSSERDILRHVGRPRRGAENRRLRGPDSLESRVETSSGPVPFGPYQLHDVQGRGAQGTVYKASQNKPTRSVALKILAGDRPADDKDIRRFHREADAIAKLRHDNIVAVHAVGECEGKHYLAMELIDGGVSLENARKDNLTTPSEAAVLVRTIALAVQHAHERGILHRDLKPSNILLGPDRKPFVADFGLARPIQRDDDLSVSGVIVGTPAYMSPEQAGGSESETTTISDVYGLGAILYALLTGKAPFEGKSIYEILRMVREEAPEPPRRSNPAIPRDLETICLKCLEKEPRRRYESAGALAADLDNFLNGRPIQGRRVNPAERAWLWCKRNPVLTMAILAVIMALGWAEITRSRSSARIAQSNEKAEQRLDLAINAVERFREVLSGSSELTSRPELGAVRQRLLQEPFDFYKKLRDDLEAQPGLDSKNRVRLARAMSNLALISVEIGKPEDSVRTFDEAIATMTPVVESSPDDLDSRANLARLYCNRGERLILMRRDQEARMSLDRSLQLWKELERKAPTVVSYRAGLGIALNNLGALEMHLNRLDEAKDWFEQARAQREPLAEVETASATDRDFLATTLMNLGVAEYRSGAFEAARPHYDRTITILRELHQSDPENAEASYDLARAYINRGTLFKSTGRFDDATVDYEQARQVMEKLVQSHPSTYAYRGVLAATHLSLGRMTAKNPREFDQALHSYQEALAILEHLVEDQPNVPEHVIDLASVCYEMGMVRFAMKQYPEAALVYTRACELLEPLLKANPADVSVGYKLGIYYNNLAGAYEEVGANSKAIEMALRGATTLQAVCALAPKNGDYRLALSLLYSGLAEIQLKAGLVSEAAATVRQRIALWPKDPEQLYNAACELARCARAGGTTQERQAVVSEAVETLKQAVEAGWKDAAWTSQDPDLAPLRDRPDFRRLVAELFDHAFPKDPFACDPLP